MASTEFLLGDFKDDRQLQEPPNSSQAKQRRTRCSVHTLTLVFLLVLPAAYTALFFFMLDRMAEKYKREPDLIHCRLRYELQWMT